MRLRLAVRGDAATLRRVVSLDKRLVPQAPAEGSTTAAGLLQFRYQP